MNSWDSPAFILNELPLRTQSGKQKQRHFQYKLHPASQANISRRFVVWKWDSYMQVGKYFSIVKYFHCSGYGHLCGKREHWVSGGELSYQVECQDNKMELERNYSWNIFLLSQPDHQLESISLLVRTEDWSGQSPFVWCLVILGASSPSL